MTGPTDLDQTDQPTTWLGGHPAAGSVVITVLAGVALQLTHIIDFQQRMAEVVGWTLSLRFIDFGFRTVFGALTLLAVLPWLFGHMRGRPWFSAYLRYLRLNGGPAPGFTLAASAVSVSAMLALIAGLAAATGAMRSELGSFFDDSVWFMVILALIPGVWEELAFRGLMLSNLQQHYRPWVAILVSSLLFGLFHVSNLLLRGPEDVVPEMILAAVVSIGWGYLVVKTNSVIPAMVSHYFINVLIELLLDPDASESAGTVIFGSLLIVYPILIIVVVWAVYQGRQRPSPASSAPSNLD